MGPFIGNDEVGSSNLPRGTTMIITDRAALMVNCQRLKSRIMRHFEEHTGNTHFTDSALMLGRILTESETRQKAERQFWPKVNLPDDRSECWTWNAATRGGYGNLKINQVSIKAHRLSYALAHGVIPGAFIVCHHCDTPLCVNPHHLFLGTSQDNADDMVSKGRQSVANQSGARNGNAKINDAQLEEIRARIAAGETNVSIAKDYPIGHAMVSRIRRGRAYA